MDKEGVPSEGDLTEDASEDAESPEEVPDPLAEEKANIDESSPIPDEAKGLPGIPDDA